MEDAEKLIDEIKQIKVQYKAEVSGGRKTWPKAIKTRIMQLCDLALGPQEIANRTGISYHTVSAWRAQNRARSNFHQLPVVHVGPKSVVPKKSVTVTVKGKRPVGRPPTKSVTVTDTSRSPEISVLTPGGYLVEGLDAKGLAEFFKRMGAT